MVQRWPAMLTGPDGERRAFGRAADVPRGWRARRPETQAEIDAVHSAAVEAEAVRHPAPISDDPKTISTSDIRQHVGPNGETWGGRGRKPRWLIEAEAAGGNGA
jgi:hypothetical protein